MEEILKFAKENNVPVVRPKTLELLIETIKNNNPKQILEIGTAIGYSGSHMLINSEAHLTTIEKYEKMYNIAKDNFRRLGIDNRVNQILGDAKDILNQLLKRGKSLILYFLMVLKDNIYAIFLCLMICLKMVELYSQMMYYLEDWCKEMHGRNIGSGQLYSI